MGDELGGHIVTGHADGVAEILSETDEGDSTRVLFRAPGPLAKFIAPKGSVCLNGTSLTVNEVDGATFGVNLIPHTKTVTTWGDRRPGDRVNLEIDTLARYVARLGHPAGSRRIWCDTRRSVWITRPTPPPVPTHRRDAGLATQVALRQS